MPLTSEQIEKSRAEFERECGPFFAFPFWDIKRSNGEYHYYAVQIGYKCWLARQETLCVDLPEMNCDHDDGFNTYDARPVQLAIESAGIAHK